VAQQHARAGARAARRLARHLIPFFTRRFWASRLVIGRPFKVVEYLVVCSTTSSSPTCRWLRSSSARCRAFVRRSSRAARPADRFRRHRAGIHRDADAWHRLGRDRGRRPRRTSPGRARAALLDPARWWRRSSRYEALKEISNVEPRHRHRARLMGCRLRWPSHAHARPDVTDRILALDTLYVNSAAMLVLYGLKLGVHRYYEAGAADRDARLHNHRRAVEVPDARRRHRIGPHDGTRRC